MKNKTELVNKLLASMNENSEQWELGEFRFTNKEWGIDLWIANGRSAIKIKPQLLYTLIGGKDENCGERIKKVVLKIFYN